MPGFIAIKLCPQLRFVEHSVGKYEAASAQGRAVFERYDPRCTMLSLDEASLDLTRHVLQGGPPRGLCRLPGARPPLGRRARLVAPAHCLLHHVCRLGSDLTGGLSPR
jgi:nucleotidyltransferase/DNA polymerase involved in DNA repair